jgi:nitroreductase
MLNKLKKLVKNVLAIRFVRNIYNSATKIVLNVSGINRLTASIYSVLGFLTFNREQYAVLRARRNYYRNLKNDSRRTHVELRRNIHRLEKGIIMQPRRPVFARDYIGETVDFYEEAVAQHKKDAKSLDKQELAWAHDVLGRYFSLSATGDKQVDAARTHFEKMSQHYGGLGTVERFPYDHDTIVKSDISYEQLLQLAQQRRSVRWFKQKKVPRTLIDKALMVGRQAPTACNRLPYEFKIFDDPEMVKKVSAIPFGTAGYAHQIPAIAVVVGKLDSYFSPRDRHAIYVDSSLAAMSFMFGLETLGLSSTVVNWPDFEPLEAKMQKTLGLDVSERVVMLIAFGYADPKGGVPFSQKKSLEVIRHYNELASS